MTRIGLRRRLTEQTSTQPCPAIPQQTTTDTSPDGYVESAAAATPACGTDGRQLAPGPTEDPELADGVEVRATNNIGSATSATDLDREPVADAVQGHDSEGPNASKAALGPWKKWAKEFWVGGAAAVVTGVLILVLSGWLNSVAGPPTPVAPSPKPSVNSGQLPGRLDVSTMSPGQRFYAVPNFYFFQSCGRPCWLPLYQLPTEESAFVTNGWPCEYYGPNTSSEPSCLQPPSQRTPSEMRDPANRNSGDRVLVVCQVTQISKEQVADTIHNEVGQSSDIWDMVAVPKSYISTDSTAAGHLHQVPGMPGFYEAYGPDIWLGNTGWHSIPCKLPRFAHLDFRFLRSAPRSWVSVC